jgi:hypothetical protein
MIRRTKQFPFLFFTHNLRLLQELPCTGINAGTLGLKVRINNISSMPSISGTEV